MAHSENKPWRSVPQFGAWDQKASPSTDYSVAFSRARADRQTRKMGRPFSLGNHEELLFCNSLNNNSSMRGENFMKKGRSKSLRHLLCMAPF